MKWQSGCPRSDTAYDGRRSPPRLVVCGRINYPADVGDLLFVDEHQHRIPSSEHRGAPRREKLLPSADEHDERGPRQMEIHDSLSGGR